MEKKSELVNGPTKIHHHHHHQPPHLQHVSSNQLQPQNATHTIVNSTNNSNVNNNNNRKSSETVTSPNDEGGEMEEEEIDDKLKLKPKESTDEVSTSRTTLADLLDEEPVGEEEGEQIVNQQLDDNTCSGNKVNEDSISKENLDDVSEKNEESEPVIGVQKV